MEKKLLYIIDERGLKGGAHIATELLIDALQMRGYTVEVMEAVRRDSFWGIVYRAYSRINITLHLHLPPTPNFFRDPLGFKCRQMLRYDTVCVMSETSVLSPIVAKLPPSVRKVQLIHTNYPMWAKLTKRDVAADAKLFAKFDAIGCVGTIGVKQFEEMFPACKGKVFPFHNIIKHGVVGCQSLVVSESNFNSAVNLNLSPQPHSPIRLISLARINDKLAKDGPRMIRVAKRLHDAGVKFVWDNYGGSGNGFVACQQEVERLGLQGVFRIHPFDSDAPAKIADANILVLLSHYEGLPNVIYEALLQGVPVFATHVGGIPEQVQDGANGWLVQDDEDAIVARMSDIMLATADIQGVKKNASQFKYDNEKVVLEHERLYFKS